MREYTFSIGYPFFYWQHYKDKKKQDLQNETVYHNLNDYCGYSPHQLYITQKYKDLKDEIINNKINALSLLQMNVSILKTNKLMQTFKVKSIRCNAPNDVLHYEIGNHSRLRYSHLLSLVLYSDRSELQCDFTKTFRKTNQYQTLSDIKQNNREYYHWSKNIREAVEYYGNLGWKDHWNDDKRNYSHNNIKGPFYSGMSYKMVIPEIMIRLNGPCSSTKKIEVATRFGGDDGIIIKLDNNSYYQSYSLRCFDMNWISNYSGEDEYLWCGGRLRIRISSILTIKDNVNYDKYFKSMYYFDAMLTSTFMKKKAKVRDQDRVILSNLIKYRLSPEFVNNYPNYINQTFCAYCNNKLQICINITDLKQYFEKIKDLVVEELVQLTIDDDDDIPYNDKNIFKSIIFSIFPNLKHVILITTGWSLTGEYEEYKINISYLISLLFKLLSLHNNKIKTTIRAYHNYKIKVDKQEDFITERVYVDSSWISKQWIKMEETHQQQHYISFKQQSVKDKRGEMITDILCIDQFDSSLHK